MRMVDLIAKKRDQQELTQAEIEWLVAGYVQDLIPDYQMSALLMAIYFNGMAAQEVSALAKAMLASGQRLDLSTIPGIKVDKHSTGGIGDKITLPLLPLVASLGVPVPMISGRGLGNTGGTLDKLESIPGFTSELTTAAFIAQVKTLHQAIISANADLAPADRRLYALRDVTGTVASIPLIASSIMAKKLASGTDALVFDVKSGNGAFMRTEEDAKALAETLVTISKQAKVPAVALITDMNQPLGVTIGNSLEVAEAIAILNDRGPKDVRQLTIALAAHMLVLGYKAPSLEVATGMCQDALRDGRAMAAFKQLVAAQGGDVSVITDPQKLPRAPHKVAVTATSAGYVGGIDADALGQAVMQLGGGRQQVGDTLDHRVGVVLHKKLGTPVAIGETLAVIHTATPDIAAITQLVKTSFTIEETPPVLPPLIHQVVR